ncbi:hypothetical protein TWF718_000698 [Orbilia javanica]|uniref:Uncharacterized protein n=1 Tax=Orbilia javanica TaxID=47235 RepID=A0AAN8RM74_9PEZI
MDPNPLSVTIPSEPLGWWAHSKIANWRRFVDVAGIKDADPKDLSIFDWKIIFEIALRSSTWRLCPSMAFGEFCEIPIFGTIQEVDFVTGKAVFRLHPSTTVPLIRQHAKYVSSRRKSLPLKQAVEILQAFERRIDVMQIRLHAGVLDATDGTPGADFPKYASSRSARKSVKDMLSIVLKETGLRKVILDAFVEIQPSIPSFVFGPCRSLGGGSLGGVRTTHSTPSPLLLPAQFPLNELHSLISENQPRRYRQAEPGIRPSPHCLFQQRQTSSLTPPGQSKKRAYTPLIKTSAIKSSRPGATGSSPLTSEIKWSDPPSPSSASHNRRGSRKSPSVCPSTDSGIDINTPTPRAASSPQQIPAKLVQGGKEPTFTIIPDGRSSALPSSSNKTTLKVKRVSLNNDELAIYRMDSSFAPVTRQQAAIELKKTPRSVVGVGRVRIVGELTPRELVSVQRNSPGTSKNTDGYENGWYNEDMQPNHPQEQGGTGETEDGEMEEGGLAHQRGFYPSGALGVNANAVFGINRFGISTLNPGRDSKEIRKGKKKRKRQEKKTHIPDDYTDEEDFIPDSDTPTIELLCDSENSEDHRNRKYRRRERKKLKAEKRERMEAMERLDQGTAMLDPELEEGEVLEAAENTKETTDGVIMELD